jgi:hypothetical protein
MKKISIHLIEDFHSTVKLALGILFDMPSPRTDAQWAVIRQVSPIPTLVVANNRKVGGFDAAFAAAEVEKAERSIRLLRDEDADPAADLLQDLVGRLMAG